MHACATVATPHQREIWTRQPPGTVVTDIEDRDYNDEDSVMHPLIHM